MQKYYLNKEITQDDLYAEGFHFEDFAYTKFYPVLFYQTKRTRTPTTWLRVRIDLEDGRFDSLVMCAHDMIDSTYYTDYGNTATYKLKIDRNIRRVMLKLCEREIIMRRKGK